MFIENFAIRLNSVSIEKSQQSTGIQLRELKVLTVKNKNIPYSCIRAEDINDYLAYVKSTQIVNKKKVGWTVNLLEEIVGFWSTDLHLKVFYLVQDMFEFANNMKQTNITNANKKFSETLNLQIYGGFAFHIKISEEHSAKVTLGNFTCEK